jgi:hypothetical protein
VLHGLRHLSRSAPTPTGTLPRSSIVVPAPGTQPLTAPPPAACVAPSLPAASACNDDVHVGACLSYSPADDPDGGCVTASGSSDSDADGDFKLAESDAVALAASRAPVPMIQGLGVGPGVVNLKQWRSPLPSPASTRTARVMASTAVPASAATASKVSKPPARRRTQAGMHSSVAKGRGGSGAGPGAAATRGGGGGATTVTAAATAVGAPTVIPSRPRTTSGPGARRAGGMQSTGTLRCAQPATAPVRKVTVTGQAANSSGGGIHLQVEGVETVTASQRRKPPENVPGTCTADAAGITVTGSALAPATLRVRQATVGDGTGGACTPSGALYFGDRPGAIRMPLSVTSVVATARFTGRVPDSVPEPRAAQEQDSEVASGLRLMALTRSGAIPAGSVAAPPSSLASAESEPQAASAVGCEKTRV